MAGRQPCLEKEVGGTAGRANPKTRKACVVSLNFGTISTGLGEGRGRAMPRFYTRQGQGRLGGGSQRLPPQGFSTPCRARAGTEGLQGQPLDWFGEGANCRERRAWGQARGNRRISCPGKGMNTERSAHHCPEAGESVGSRGWLLPATKGALEALPHPTTFSRRVLLQEQPVHSQGRAPEATGVARPLPAARVIRLFGESLGCRKQARGPSETPKPGAVPESQEA